MLNEPLKSIVGRRTEITSGMVRRARERRSGGMPILLGWDASVLLRSQSARQQAQVLQNCWHRACQVQTLGGYLLGGNPIYGYKCPYCGK